MCQDTFPEYPNMRVLLLRENCCIIPTLVGMMPDVVFFRPVCWKIDSKL